MQIIKYPKKQTWSKLLARPTLDTKFLERTVANILDDVRKHGDSALKHCARHFDKVELDDFLVSDAEFAEAETFVSGELKSRD
jgi:histidinol dehydrogenase